MIYTVRSAGSSRGPGMKQLGFRWVLRGRKTPEHPGPESLRPRVPRCAAKAAGEGGRARALNRNTRRWSRCKGRRARERGALRSARGAENGRDRVTRSGLALLASRGSRESARTRRDGGFAPSGPRFVLLLSAAKTPSRSAQDAGRELRNFRRVS